MGRIGVVGSVNVDMVATGARLPSPGETVTDAVFSILPGGKGANQALAVKRLGGDPILIAKVGTDPNADLALALLRHDGVDLERAWRDRDHQTGVALIAVDARGENQIIVAPGANRHLLADDVDVSGCDAVLAQLEVPVETVAAAAAAAEGLFILNAAPFRPVPDSLLERCDVVIVNETEAASFGTRLDQIDVTVITTLGSRGATATLRGVQFASAPAPVVETVDTVGAGDTFTAAIAVALLERMPMPEALAWSCAAAALATTRHGAQPAIPTRAEVSEFMEAR